MVDGSADRPLFRSEEELAETCTSVMDYPPPERILYGRVLAISVMLEHEGLVAAMLMFDRARRLIAKARRRGLITDAQEWALHWILQAQAEQLHPET